MFERWIGRCLTDAFNGNFISLDEIALEYN